MSLPDPLTDDAEVLGGAELVTSAEAGGVAVPRAACDKSGVAWSYDEIEKNFGDRGCSGDNSQYNCTYNSHTGLLCALNLSDAIKRAGLCLPPAKEVNYCNHGRVRNADGMARIVRKVCGRPKVTAWSKRPKWKGIVYFEGPNHIDLWNGQRAVHTQYENAPVVWFFKCPGD